MAMMDGFLGAAGEPVAETPPVTLSAFIDSLQLTDDPDDVALMMEACQVNRIKVSSISLFRECGAMFLLSGLGCSVHPVLSLCGHASIGTKDNMRCIHPLRADYHS